MWLQEYQNKAPFTPSLLVEFRKRLTDDILTEINEMIVRLERISFDAYNEGDVQIGQPISSTFEIDITDNTLVQDKENLSVAAVLIDKRSWEIINSDKNFISVTTGISNMTDGTTVVPTARYSLSGQRIGKERKGLNIVRQSDGSTKKVIER